MSKGISSPPPYQPNCLQGQILPTHFTLKDDTYYYARNSVVNPVQNSQAYSNFYYGAGSGVNPSGSPQQQQQPQTSGSQNPAPKTKSKCNVCFGMVVGVTAVLIGAGIAVGVMYTLRNGDTESGSPSENGQTTMTISGTQVQTTVLTTTPEKETTIATATTAEKEATVATTTSEKDTTTAGTIETTTQTRETTVLTTIPDTTTMKETTTVTTTDMTSQVAPSTAAPCVTRTITPILSANSLDNVDHQNCSTNPCGSSPCHERQPGYYCRCHFPLYGDRCEYENLPKSCDLFIADKGVATPTVSATVNNNIVFSCGEKTNVSCASEVHMIAIYEPEGTNRPGNTQPTFVPEVSIEIESSTPHLPLTLVLSSYEAVQWMVHLPEGIVVDHVLMVSFYLAYSNVTIFHSNGTELNNHQLHTTDKKTMDRRGTGAPPRPYHTLHGCFTCLGVDEVMETMASQHGCFASFSGTYYAKSWKLNLDKKFC